MMAVTDLLRVSVCTFLLVFLLQSHTEAFKFFSSQSMTHQAITRAAILQTTAEVCRSQAIKNGRNFEMPNPLTEESLAKACFSPDSAKGFKKSICKINGENAWVDIRHVFTAKYHFDDESFVSGRELITQGMITIKASIKRQNYEAAREKLGEILHTLQDFYSHSNWIELGNRAPYSNLIKPTSPIDNIADSATCKSCNGDDCTGNLLDVIFTQKKLTSGYFSLWSSSKPEGKCSHGGFLDRTSYRDPKGGINKDGVDTNHGYLHSSAAEVAIAATRELLEDIRAAAGDSEFLRLMGFSQNSVLCFVIDTTGSMGDDIAEVRRVTSLIIDSKKGTKDQPSEYILVPFNDPEFGPLTKTTDPEVFKGKISALTATGGGDAPEMCFSGLQLALTGSPPQTEIFVFTDAPAKDTQLKGTVLALIERTKSVVNFLLTNALGARRRRSSGQPLDDQQQLSSRVGSLNNQDYFDLAQASGGQAIEVTKSTLPSATSIIIDTSTSAVVTVFQAVRDPAKPEKFTFFVDSSLQNLTIYITSTSPYYNITSPSGISQTSNEKNGSLGVIQTIGNFHTIRLSTPDQTGLWQLYIDSSQPYTIKVLGQSGVDFLFDFIEVSEGPHPSYAVLKSRPSANSNLTILLTMVGGDSGTPTEVALIDSSSNSFNGTLEQVASGQYLVTIKSVPAGEFSIRVVGDISSARASNNRFQRQSSTKLQASSVTITTQADGTMEPGTTFNLSFTVTSNGTGGNFAINVINDRSFQSSFPTSLTLSSDGSANGTVTLLAPGNTLSGTDVTVTIEATAPGGTDSNYAVLRLAVVAKVTDLTPPLCEIVSVNANCSGNCSLASWDLSANMTDGNGTGIQSVYIRQGIGNLSTSTVVGDKGWNVTMAFYTASCCYPDVELVAVDAVGNVGSCFRSVAIPTVPPSVPSTTVVTTAVTTVATSTSTTIKTSTNSAQRCLFPPVFFWIHVAAILVYQIMQL